METIVIIALCVSGISVVGAIFTAYVFSRKLYELSKEAFTHIKASTIEEKVRADGLDRQLKQLDKHTDEYNKNVTKLQRKKPKASASPQPKSDMMGALLKDGEAKDDNGVVWELL